jgi:dTDP-4-amino-4,6-dideoxygalactose transaminase
MSRAVETLEREFAAALGVAGSVAAGFGRSALFLALESIPVRGGDVLVPGFICAQVPGAVRRAGGRPVFYPVQRELRVNPADFQAAFTPRTRAAIVAHYFGRLLPEVSLLARVCREHDVALLEDCALALGASMDGRQGGSFGDLSIFSFTKSDWCYGGGAVTSNSPERLARLRALREEKFRASRELSFRYGLLRRADFAANRPSLSQMAERTGRWLERLGGKGEGNFYDAGRFDTALPAFAARRARRALASLPTATARRQLILRQLIGALRDAGQVLLRPQPDPGDAASFLLVECRTGKAENWLGKAARSSVTLRRCWPAYQAIEGAQASRALAWLAEHLLVLEVHPQLIIGEVERITQTLERLALGENPEPTPP